MTDLARSAASSRNRTIAYWLSTSLVAAESVLGGAWDLLRIPYVTEDLERLGYPLYVLTIIGIWKLLGAVAILVPRFPRSRSGPTQGCSSTTWAPSPPSWR